MCHIMAVAQLPKSDATDGDVGDVTKLAQTSPLDSQPSSSSPDPELDENQPLLDESEAMPPDESTDDDASKRVLRKIDRTIIPLLFVTYMFNFMDKAILSSAAVFGLREDNVRQPPSASLHPHH
jgi:hypothetical protein